MSYSGFRAESIVHFNEVLPPSLHKFVVEGLLEAARNEEGFPNQRAAAIQTIRWLPENVVSESNTFANHDELKLG
jgi:hypothetical protein